MTYRYIWGVPTSYETPDSEDLSYDLTSHAVKVLKNKVWTRKFWYGYGPAFQSEYLEPNILRRLEIKVSNPPFHLLDPDLLNPHKLINYLRKCLGNVVENDIDDIILKSRIGILRKALLFIEMEVDVDIDFPKQYDDGVKISKFKKIRRGILNFVQEIGALFRAGLLLTFIHKHLHYPDFQKLDLSGGVIFIESKGEWSFNPEWTSDYTFPAVFSSEQRTEFELMLNQLADCWHLPLWPIHRYLKALNTYFVEMESLLNLLYAIEGLFDHSTGTQLIRLAASLLLGRNITEAQEINKVLKHAYKIRNEIVHGAKFYTGLEVLEGIDIKDMFTEKNDFKFLEREFREDGFMKDTSLAHYVFLKTRIITADLIKVALKKLRNTPGMKCLRITDGDIVEKFFAE